MTTVGACRLLKITDNTGRNIPLQSVHYGERIDLSNQPDGWYFITLWTDGQTWMERVLKNKRL